MAFCAVIGAAFGLLYRLPAVGPALAGIGLIVPLAAGLVMTLLMAGLRGRLAPLARRDGRRGRRRARRPEPHLRLPEPTLRLISPRLVGLAWLEGMLGLAVGDLLTAGVIRLTHWSLGLTGPARVTDAFFGSPDTSSGTSPPRRMASGWEWCGCLRTAWVYSFFWTAAAYLYLWLRQDVDGQPWTEIEPARLTPSAPRGGEARRASRSYQPQCVRRARA